MHEFERERMTHLEQSVRALSVDLKSEQQKHATAMQVVAAANAALEQIVTDLEGRARAVRGLIKQISKMPKARAVKAATKRR